MQTMPTSSTPIHPYQPPPPQPPHHQPPHPQSPSSSPPSKHRFIMQFSFLFSCTKQNGSTHIAVLVVAMKSYASEICQCWLVREIWKKDEIPVTWNQQKKWWNHKQLWFVRCLFVLFWTNACLWYRHAELYANYAPFGHQSVISWERSKNEKERKENRLKGKEQFPFFSIGFVCIKSRYNGERKVQSSIRFKWVSCKVQSACLLSTWN